MINPKTLLTLKKSKEQFESTHPKFSAMIGQIISGDMIEEGTVIEISVTKADGTNITGNMKVQPSDMDLFNNLKDLGM